MEENMEKTILKELNKIYCKYSGKLYMDCSGIIDCKDCSININGYPCLEKEYVLLQIIKTEEFGEIYKKYIQKEATEETPIDKTIKDIICKHLYIWATTHTPVEKIVDNVVKDIVETIKQQLKQVLESL